MVTERVSVVLVYVKLTRERRKDSLPISNTKLNFMVLSEANQNQLLFSSSGESRKSLSHCSPFVEVNSCCDWP